MWAEFLVDFNLTSRIFAGYSLIKSDSCGFSILYSLTSSRIITYEMKWNRVWFSTWLRRQSKSTEICSCFHSLWISPRTNTEPDEERKVLNQVENIPTEGFQKPTKVKRRNSSKKGSENKPLPRKRLNIIHKPHSSTSVSSSDEDTAQQIRIRQGSTPSRLGHRHVTGTPGFGFGSGKKVILKKTVPKFNPENKRKKKLLKPSNTASSLGLKV